MQGPPAPSMCASSSDRRVLQEHVREGLLRGVRGDVALRRFGECFSVPDGSLTAAKPEDLALSEVTTRLDDFLSHDWQTSRWSKFLALCVLYNGDAALAASCAVALMGTALMNEPFAVMPKTSALDQTDADVSLHVLTAPWGFLSSSACFWVVLLFGQRIRAITCRARIVFLDRVCINQVDEQEKCEGVACLAGFMRHSDRLVVLWSPRYFTRLWCVYEMASWLHLGRELAGSMIFMPVAFSVGLLLLNTLGFFIGLLALVAYSSDVPAMLGKYKVGFIILAAAIPWGVHALRVLGSERFHLAAQLEQFSIRNSDCFCCRHDHVHPSTGHSLPCDRALVYRTLHARYMQKHGVATADEALDEFDISVRTTFKEAVFEAFGTVQVSYRQALLMGAPAAWLLPDTCADIDRLAPPSRGLRYAACYLALFLCMMPSVLKVTLVAAMLSVKRCPPRRSCAIDAAVAFGVALLAPALGAVLWLPTYYFARGSERPELQLCTLAAHTALTLACFWRPSACRRRRRRECRGAPLEEVVPVPAAGASLAALASESFN